MRRLDCLVISTGRAASTAVYYYLNELAVLRLPWNKEPHFWCNLARYSGRYKLLDSLNVHKPAEYENIYSNSKMMIDASVGYFFCIEEVAEKLRMFGQRPKILFLYRDPVSRAKSLFNELVRKGLETEPNVAAALCAAQERSGGQWWEHYYDNVHYKRVLQTARDLSDGLLAISYDAFARSPEAAMMRILSFLDISPIKKIRYSPLNTSEQAIVAHSARRLRWAAPLLPPGVKQLLGKWFFLTQATQKIPREILCQYLPNSIAEYEAFRNLVREQDYYDSRNH